MAASEGWSEMRIQCSTHWRLGAAKFAGCWGGECAREDMVVRSAPQPWRAVAGLRAGCCPAARLRNCGGRFGGSVRLYPAEGAAGIALVCAPVCSRFCGSVRCTLCGCWRVGVVARAGVPCGCWCVGTPCGCWRLLRPGCPRCWHCRASCGLLSRRFPGRSPTPVPTGEVLPGLSRNAGFDSLLCARLRRFRLHGFTRSQKQRDPAVGQCRHASEPKAGSTLKSSRAAPHPSTNRALRRLTSEVGRDPVHSTRYGRRQR